jgi:hypothetical protein
MMVLKRFQQFTISDAISYMGGILGLLAGISMMTIVEYFYLFFLKVFELLGKILRGRSFVN